MKQISGLDNMFFRIEDETNHMHICGINIYDQSTAEGKKVRFKQILRHIHDRLHTSTIFRRKLVKVPFDLDNPYWIEYKNFDLEYHVRHMALPKPGDWRQLCIAMSRIHSRPLDLTKPLWEMYVIEGLDNIDWLPKDSYAMVIKVHHAAIDGITGRELTASLHDLTVEPSEAVRDYSWVPEDVPGPVSLLTRAAMNHVLNPIRLGGKMVSLVPKLGIMLGKTLQQKRVLEKPKNEAPITRFNRSVSPHRVFEGRMFPLKDIINIKRNVSGATVNDVVLTICGGALRQYLERKNELPAQSLRAVTPISVRSAKELKSGGNQIGLLFPSLCTDEQNPVKRLEKIRQSTSNVKEKFNAVGGRDLTDITQYIPASTLALATKLFKTFAFEKTDLLKRFGNCTITNIPGPTMPLYMNSARMVLANGIGPAFDGNGLFFLVSSYDGKMFITFTSCRNMLPDPEFLSQCLQDVFDDLKTVIVQEETETVAKASHPETSKKAERPKKNTGSKKTTSLEPLTNFETTRDAEKGRVTKKRVSRIKRTSLRKRIARRKKTSPQKKSRPEWSFPQNRMKNSNHLNC